MFAPSLSCWHPLNYFHFPRPQAVVGRVSEVAAASQELKATRVHFGTKEDHTCDLSFSGQADTVCHAAGDLRKQVENKSSFVSGKRRHGKKKKECQKE